jgi:anthranilate 1,2-dioxygenase small subunit
MALDERLISRLRTFYDQGACFLDEMELESWTDLFSKEGHYEVISRENYEQGLPHATVYCSGLGMIQDRVAVIRKALFFEPRSQRHFVSAVRVNGVEPNGIRAQANFHLIECLPDKAPATVMLGRYIDLLRDQNNRFLISKRQCVFDNARLPRGVFIPV